VGTAELPARPMLVKVADGLLVAALVVGQISPRHLNVRFFFYAHPQVESRRLMATVAILLALEVGLIAAIVAGRRWAVNLYTAWLLFGLLNLALVAPRLLKAPSGLSSWDVYPEATQAVALILLFSRPARDWFLAVKPRRLYFDPHMGRRLE
jgi:hypothetical protein